MRSHGYRMRHGLWLSFSAAACFPLAAVHAAPGSGQTQSIVSKGVNISKDTDLRFGDFSAGKSLSRFRLDPDSGAIVQLTGNAVSLGGTQTPATFTAYGTPLETVRMTVSQNQIELTRVGGGQTMRVDQFRFDGGNGTRNRNLNVSGSVDYKLGGRLTINANQAAGAYVGTFNITIDYQ